MSHAKYFSRVTYGVLAACTSLFAVSFDPTLGTCAAAPVVNRYDDETTAEGWAWTRIRRGLAANFNERCPVAITLLTENDEQWTDACRRVSPSFIVDVLTNSTLRDQVPFSGIHIVRARIDGDLVLENANWDRALLLENCRLDGDVSLLRAHTSAVLKIQGSRVKGQIDASGLHADQWVFFNDTEDGSSHFMQRVRMAGAEVRGLTLDGSIFHDRFDGQRLHVAASLFARATSFEAPATLEFARVEGSADFAGATIAGLDLSSASIGELRLENTYHETQWLGVPEKRSGLSLRNAHVGTLSDSVDAWPPAGSLRLSGFSFAHLGGFQGPTERQASGRGMTWWDQNWARLDLEYSPEPYSNLAAAMTAVGDRDAADEIRFLGREREREMQWQDRKYSSWLLSTTLARIAGYGIGTYAFRVLYWILGFTALGAFVLWVFVPEARARHRGALWCFGASFARLLPIVELNREFTDFFDDSDRKRLGGRCAIFFTLLAAVGWLLGGILVVAISGLTHAG